MQNNLFLSRIYMCQQKSTWFHFLVRLRIFHMLSYRGHCGPNGAELDLYESLIQLKLMSFRIRYQDL